MKSALIIQKKRLGAKALKKLRRRLAYDRVYILQTQSKGDEPPEEIRPSGSFRILPVKGRADIPRAIEQVISDAGKNTMVFPFFRGDGNSKFNIRCYNKTFDTKVSARIFKDKEAMSRFLGDDLIGKKSARKSFAEVQALSYADAAALLGPSFILKPLSASSSMLNFKISNAAEWDKAKGRLKKSYGYVLEEYLLGNLYSVDLYCDGRNIFLLCLAREASIVELLEKLSGKYLEKYQGNLTEDFLHFLPLRYTLPLDELRNFELEFIRSVTAKLIQAEYRGFLHLEFKTRRDDKKVGFIEWGARLGGYRSFFIEEMHQLSVENLPREILFDQDYSRYQWKKGFYFLKNRHPDKNFVGIKTNVLKKTHIMTILKKIPNYLKTPFGDFLKDFLWDHWRIAVKNLTFHVSTSKDHYIYPFYERNDTRFDYILELDEDAFRRFVQRKHAIVERLVFHDYK